MNKPRSTPHPDWDGFLELARVLRGPDGCPWDRRQSARSLAAHLVEEAYEVLHAAEERDPEALGQEVGDTFFLLALVQAAAEEQGGTAFPEIAQRTMAKITARHPHVFAHPRELNEREVRLQWEERKRAERRESGREDPAAAMDDPPPALPALLQAFRAQERAAAIGFDWPVPSDVLPKIEEELRELTEVMASQGGVPSSHETDPGGALQEELGDLLFAVVNLCRKVEIDPEHALRRATLKFRSRFNRMAEMAEADGRHLESESLEQMDAYWNAVKQETREGGQA